MQKAKASFNVIVPTEWMAVGNNSYSYTNAFTTADYIAHAPTQNQNLLIAKYLNGKSGSFYIFQQTELLPTYLYCIVAGEYYANVLPTDQEYRVTHI